MPGRPGSGPWPWTRPGRSSTSPTGSSPSTSPGPAGSSTTPTRSGRRWPRRWPRWPRRQRDRGPAGGGHRASPTSGRRWWPGTASTGRPLHRAIVWQDRRTAGALRRAARRPATSRSSGSAPGLVLDPYFSATKMAWLLTDGGVADVPDPRPRHGRRLGDLEPDRRHRRRCARHRPHQRQPHPALRHREPGAGRTSCATSSASPLDALPEVRPSCGRFGTVAGALGGARLAAGRGAGERGGRRPAGRAVRPGLLRPGHGQGRPTAPAASSWPTSVPRARRRPRACSPPWPGTWASHRRPRSPGGLRPGGSGVRHRGRRAVAARRPRAHRRVAGDRARWPTRRRQPRASTSSPPSPASAARGGTPTPGARSSG